MKMPHPAKAEQGTPRNGVNPNIGLALAPARSSGITMTSLELVDFINRQRAQGEAVLQHRDFTAKVPKVLGVGVCEKFRIPYVNHQNGQTYQIYNFPKREACLMAMSYSYELQAKVFDRMTALEAQAATAIPNFADPVAAARAWADAKEAEQAATAELALAAPKVNFYDKVVDRATLMTASQIGQKLGMSAIKLNKRLDALGVYALNVKRARVFKQWVLDKRYGLLKQTELGYSQPLFTTAGEAWIVERLTSEGAA